MGGVEWIIMLSSGWDSELGKNVASELRGGLWRIAEGTAYN